MIPLMEMERKLLFQRKTFLQTDSAQGILQQHQDISLLASFKSSSDYLMWYLLATHCVAIFVFVFVFLRKKIIGSF